jgi:methyl-accepting chemotaxis protein
MKLTITRKIALGFGIGIIALVLLSALAFIGSGRILVRATEVSDARAIDYMLTQADTDHVLWDSQVREVLIGTEAKKVDVQIDPHKCNLGKWYYGKGRIQAEQLAPYLAPRLKELEDPHSKLHQSVVHINDLLVMGQHTEAKDYYSKTIPALVKTIRGILGDSVNELRQKAPGDAALLEIVGASRLAVGVTSVIFIIAMLLVAFLLGRNIVGVLRSAVNVISSSSAQIGATAEEHERVLSQQAASVNETSTTMDEMSATSRSSSEQAESAAMVGRTAESQATEGNRMVADMLEGMTELKKKVEAIGEHILRLSEQTSQIENITAAVTDIASQTNLLALNAAVEAARAGEQGKGFSVVAQEIRKLADQSKKSAERINVLVSDVQKVTNTTVMVTEEGTRTLEGASSTVDQAGQAFEGLVSSVGEIADNLQQIALTAKQQAAAVDQVVESMNNINAGAQQSTTGIQQTRTGLKHMNESVEQIQEMV